MPYLLPDGDTFSGCLIQFSIPTDSKWVAIINGAIAQLALAENWEEGTGILTPDEAVQAAIEIQESVTFTGC